jgi:hypothetical protein
MSNIEWIENLRTHIRENEDDVPGYMWGALDFCEKHNCVPVGNDSTVDLWGFGTVPVIFAPADGPGWWTPVYALAEPTGIDIARLLDLWEIELIESKGEDADSVQFLDQNGEYDSLDLVSGDFVMRLFYLESPWKNEFRSNVQDTMRHGLVRSGMVEKLGPVAKEITEDLPSVEVARHAALSGPLGPLNRQS